MRTRFVYNFEKKDVEEYIAELAQHLRCLSQGYPLEESDQLFCLPKSLPKMENGNNLS